MRKEGTVIKVKIGYDDICFVRFAGCKTCSEISKICLFRKGKGGNSPVDDYSASVDCYKQVCCFVAVLQLFVEKNDDLVFVTYFCRNKVVILMCSALF